MFVFGRRTVVVLLLLVLLGMFLSQGSLAASSEIEEMAFGTGIEDQGASTFRLLGKSNSFFASTDTVWCFAKVLAYSKILEATFEWYTPAGDLYYSDPHGSLDSGYVWSLRSAIRIADHKAASIPGIWTVKLRLTSGRDGVETFELKRDNASAPTSTAVLPPISPTPTIEPPSSDVEHASSGTWCLGGYTLATVGSVKCQYAYGAAHVTLIIKKPGSDDWSMVEDVKVDTGAFESMLPLGVASDLGINPETGKQIDFSGVVGSDVGWENEVLVGVILLGGGEDVDGYILSQDGEPFLFKIPVIFYGEESSGSKLLGRSGVFSALNLLFGERMLTISVRAD